jgi:hypothetical protein
MSIADVDASFPATKRRSLASDHPQLTPFLMAVAIFTVSVAVALAFIGLPQ